MMFQECFFVGAGIPQELWEQRPRLDEALQTTTASPRGRGSYKMQGISLVGATPPSR
jgi:hypothetical protein